MTNAWIEHIKQFAKRKGLTYGCSLSDPQCKAEYYAKKSPKTSKSATAPPASNEKQNAEKNSKTYPELIEKKISDLEQFSKKVEKTSYKKQEQLKIELDKLKKVGADKFGNIYPKETQDYFLNKYGLGWHHFHPTASNDKYWNIEDKLIPLYEIVKEQIENKNKFDENIYN